MLAAWGEAGISSYSSSWARQHQEEGAEIKDSHTGPCCSPTSNWGLSNLKSPKHREFVTCCDSHKVSSTGTKSQTRHQTQPYPHQDVSAQHSCPLQVFFSFLLFLPAKAEALPGLVSWAQVLIQTPHPAASHHSAPLELLFSFMGVLQNKSAQDFNSPSVPYTTQMESNT